MEKQFHIRGIIKPGSKDGSRATYRLVTSREAELNVQKILEDCDFREGAKVLLKNGWFSRQGAVWAVYEPGITRQLLVTRTSSSLLSGEKSRFSEHDWRIAMTYACENDDWPRVLDIIAALSSSGRDILAAKLPHRIEGTALHVCAVFDSTETLEGLLNVPGISQSALNSNSENILHCAAENGSVGAAKLILATEASKSMLNAFNLNGNTPLLHSIKNSHYSICELLLGTPGIKPELADHSGTTPLHRAIEMGQVNVIDMLLKHPTATESALVNKPDDKGQTPLLLAASKGQADICSMLLEADARNSLRVQDDAGRTPLHVASTNREVLQVLLKWCTSETFLMFCAKSQQLVNRKLQCGLTALHIAAIQSNREMTPLLIRNGAFLDVRNDDGDTCLHIAAKKRDRLIFDCFLGAQPILTFSDKRLNFQEWLSMGNARTGDTALHIAVRNSDRSCESNEMARDLIQKHRAFVDVQNKNGETALHLWARQGTVEVGEALLPMKDDVHRPATRNAWNIWLTMCNLEGETALHLAVRRGDEDVVGRLLQDPDVNDQLLEIRDADNRTALYWALQLEPDVKRAPMLKKLFDAARWQKTKAFLQWSLESTDVEADVKKFNALGKEIKLSIESNHSVALLKQAIESEDLHMASLLIYEGADATKLDKRASAWLSKNLCERTSDRPAPKDSLGRRPLVKGIAALLLSPFTATPITLGILGEWGMGKSSVMLQVEEVLLEMAANETLMSSNLRSQVVKILRLTKDQDEPIPYRAEYRQLFKHLALTHPPSTHRRPSRRQIVFKEPALKLLSILVRFIKNLTLLQNLRFSLIGRPIRRDVYGHALMMQ